MVTEDMLTLIINTLRDVAESKRMPSGSQVTEGVAQLHEEAAIEMERYRKALRLSDNNKHFNEIDQKLEQILGPVPKARRREDELS